MIHLLLELLLCLTGVTVTLPMEARVFGTEIELGEVAAIDGVDPEVVARVAAVELGYAPSPGYSRVLVAERIRERLRQQLPGVAVQVVGERACRVHPEVVDVAGHELIEAARAEVARVFGEANRIVAASEVSNVQVPAGAGPPELIARVRAGEKATGTVSVPVEVRVDGVRYRTVWTTWRVEVYETRAVLARPVRIGEELLPGMFVHKRIQVPLGRTTAPLDDAMVVGAVAKRDLSAGELVTALDVHRPTVVTLGEPLILRVSKGAITAQITVQALESGAVGDRIRVRTSGTSQELVATVKSRTLCELNL